MGGLPYGRRAGAGRLWLACLLAGLLAACGAEPVAETGLKPHEASLQLRDATVRANLIPTGNLSEAMARQYGIERGEGTVLLLVSVRRPADGGQVSLPARVSATATDLHGTQQTIELRELEAGGFLDHAGTFQARPRDTLTFAVEVRREGEPPATLRFNHDF
ncbi:DUF4426 domain-containing protein [Novilysobacter defluvii]|uniref:DUF4426 domain-containing protein n=1 Tax=Novilysobacter defluvii TaxID=391738 RepID=UPI00137855AE|nr:DUF4426 domain-containing protein [Lysobacter defluvii]